RAQGEELTARPLLRTHGTHHRAGREHGVRGKARPYELVQVFTRIPGNGERTRAGEVGSNHTRIGAGQITEGIRDNAKRKSGLVDGYARGRPPAQHLLGPALRGSGNFPEIREGQSVRPVKIRVPFVELRHELVVTRITQI